MGQDQDNDRVEKFQQIRIEIKWYALGKTWNRKKQRSTEALTSFDPSNMTAQ